MILTNVILHPSRALESIERHPRWAKPLLGMSLLHLLLSYTPVILAPTLFQRIDASQLGLMGAALIPILIRNTVNWGFYALLLYLVVVLVSQNVHKVSYKTLFSLVVYSNILLLIGQILMVVVSLIRWAYRAIPSFEQTRLINLGVVAIWADLDSSLIHFAQKIDPFAAWQLIFLSHGTWNLTRLGKRISVCVVVLTWLISVAMGTFVRDQMGVLLK